MLELLKKVTGYIDDPRIRLTDDILDDINRVRLSNGEQPITEEDLPLYAYCPGCQKMNLHG